MRRLLPNTTQRLTGILTEVLMRRSSSMLKLTVRLRRFFNPLGVGLLGHTRLASSCSDNFPLFWFTVSDRLGIFRWSRLPTQAASLDTGNAGSRLYQPILFRNSVMWAA